MNWEGGGGVLESEVPVVDENGVGGVGTGEAVLLNDAAIAVPTTIGVVLHVGGIVVRTDKYDKRIDDLTGGSLAREAGSRAERNSTARREENRLVTSRLD